MKKIKQILTVLLMTIVLMPQQQIFAVSGGITISGPTTLKPGETGSYVISFSANETAFFSYNVSGSNLTLDGPTSNGVFGTGESKTEKVTIKAKAGSVGTATISVSGSVASTIDGSENGISGSLGISVVVPPAPTTDTPKPSTPKPSTPKPGLPQLDSTEEDKAGNTVTPEEQAKKEEVRKEQELEALKKVPLISGIEIISASVKFQGDVLETFKIGVDIFDFSYTLPKRIEEFSLKINAPEGVTLSYVENHKFETEQEEIAIVVTAKKEEVEQKFNVVVKRNIFESVEKNVFDSTYTVYDDERLDAFIETIGAEKIDGTHFKFEDLLFQLVVDTDNKAKWLLLNEDLTDKALGLIHLNAEGELLFILESDDLANETLYGEKHSKKELVIDERITAIDPSLIFETSYKGTTYEDGVIVYAMNSKGVEGNHFVSDDDTFTYAVVAFDQVNMTYKYVAWGSSIALIALVGALVLTKVLNRKKSI